MMLVIRPSVTVTVLPSAVVKVPEAPVMPRLARAVAASEAPVPPSAMAMGADRPDTVPPLTDPAVTSRGTAPTSAETARPSSPQTS